LKFQSILACSIGLLVSEARAATPLCHPFSTFGKPLARCEDNFVVSEEALNCVDYYYKHVEAGKLKVKKIFDEQIAKMKKEQSDSFDRTDEGYARAQKEVNDLIATGALARTVVDGYFDEMYFPEDYDEPSVTGMSSEEYLATEECFAGPKKAIQEGQRMIDTIMADLKAMNLSAAKKESKSEKRSVNVQAITPKALPTTKGQGSAAPRVPASAGKSQNGASDITNTQKAIEDAKTAEDLINFLPSKK
jgi:hypothetical protein